MRSSLLLLHAVSAEVACHSLCAHITTGLPPVAQGGDLYPHRRPHPQSSNVHTLCSAEPPSEEELRAKLREHNAAAVRDAEARKERQRKQAEKKKAKVARQKAERKAGKQQPHLAQASWGCLCSAGGLGGCSPAVGAACRT